MSEKQREYNSSDSYMYETSLTLHGLFIANINPFSEFDSMLNLVFANKWRNAIKEVELLVRDSAIRDQQSQLTENVEKALEKSQRKYREVKYFADKTFPDSSAHRNEFGLDTYTDIRTMVPSMILFLEEMHQACTKYSSKLIENGYSLLRIEEIIAIKEELREANLSQEMFKKGRPTQTQDRITILNNCYAFTSQVLAAAQLVFENEPSKAQQFVFIRSVEKPKQDNEKSKKIDNKTKPTTDKTKPTDTTDKPTDTADKPTDTADKPTDSQPPTTN